MSVLEVAAAADDESAFTDDAVDEPDVVSAAAAAAAKARRTKRMLPWMAPPMIETFCSWLSISVGKIYLALFWGSILTSTVSDVLTGDGAVIHTYRPLVQEEALGWLR